MAHRGEAQTFLKQLKLKLINENLSFYANKESSIGLVLTGEGHFDVLTKLPYLIADFKIKRITNYGIAGALDKKMKLNQIHSIRTCYSYLETKPQFKSFTTSDEKAHIDCISAIERILDDQRSDQLSHFAHMVDRELWSVGKCAKLYKIPFYAYKLASDYAQTDTNCFDIKDKALLFSNELFQHFESDVAKTFKTKKTESELEKIIPKASFTQIKRIEKLLNNLELKKTFSLKQLITESNIDIDKKENINKLCQYIEAQISPNEEKLFAKIHQSMEPFYNIGAKVALDQKKEKSDFSLQMIINSEKNLDNLSQAISEFSYQEFKDRWNGRQDV